MKGFLSRAKTYVLRGVLAIMPLFLSVFVVRLLYTGIDQRVVAWISDYTKFSIPGLGILLVIFVLYLSGLIASNVFGKRIFNWLENISRKIPIVNTTYQVGKQLADTFSLPERKVFKRALLVDFLKPGTWTIGFETGRFVDCRNDDAEYLKVFIPTPPNPTSGWMIVVRPEDVRDPGWTIDEAMRLVISGGIIGPDVIR